MVRRNFNVVFKFYDYKVNLKKGLPYDFLIIIIGLYLYLWNTFCIFLIIFTAMQLIIVKESRRNIKRKIKFT